MLEVVATEWRNNNRNVNYPFADGATLQSEEGVLFGRDSFDDARIYLAGASGKIYISRINLDGSTVTIYVGDTVLGELASASLFFTGTADPGPEAIFRVPVAGGDPVPLLHGDLSEPHVSPDGGQVIYSLYDAGYAYLHTIPAAGGAPRRLTASDVAYDMLPQWSPDGSAVVLMPYDYPTSIEYIARLLSLEGNAARTVVKDRALSLGSPTWTPDGKAIVYQGVDTRSQVVRVPVADLLERAQATQDSSAGAGQGG